MTSCPTDTGERLEALRVAVTEALGLQYASPEMFGNVRIPTDAEIVTWVGEEHSRVRRIHEGHHRDIPVGFCGLCGMYVAAKSTAP